MDNRRVALGYMLLACKRLGYTKKETRNLFEEMHREFDVKTEEEAEEMGFSWYNNLPEGEEKPTPRKRNATPAMLTKFPDGFKPKEIKELEKLRDLMYEHLKMK